MWEKIIGLILLVVIIVIAASYEGKESFEEPLLTFRFDDCYESQLKAYEVLKENDLTATFYCITNSLGKEDYMTWEQAEKLYAEGFDIGSHGKTHKNLLMLTIAEQKEEITGSRKNLSMHKIKVTSFAYPYGIYNPLYMKEVEGAYMCASTYPILKGSFNYKNTDRLKLNCMRNFRNATDFEDSLNEAINKSAWMVACFHRIGDGEGRYYTKEEDFKEIVRVAKEYQDKGLIRIVNFNEACSLLG